MKGRWPLVERVIKGGSEAAVLLTEDVIIILSMVVMIMEANVAMIATIMARETIPPVRVLLSASPRYLRS